MLPNPVALLLDFGGVLADAPAQDPATPELVLRLYNLTGGSLSPGEIKRALTEGHSAYAAWRDEDLPEELTHVEVWERFVTEGWPRPARVWPSAGPPPTLRWPAWRAGGPRSS